MFGFKGGKWMHHSQTHGHGHSHGHDKSQSPKKPNVILTPVPGTAYKIVSAMNDSMALTLKQGKSHTIVIDTFQSQDSQKFFFAIEHGKYTITSALENRHLHVDEDSHQNGANIHGAHKPHKSFVFQILPITTGPMAGKGIGFKTVSGKAFDIKGGQANSGTEVCQWDFHGGNNQIWILVPVAISYNTKASLPAEFVANPDQTYKIISVMDWKLSLTVKNQGNHTLSLETFTNDPTQQFHIYQENKKSAFVVVSTNNALCIFKDNKQNNGEIRTDAGNYPSSWFDVVPVTTGEWAHRAYILRTFAGKVADIHGGVANIGNRVCQWQGHGGNCQSWLIVPAEQAIV